VDVDERFFFATTRVIRRGTSDALDDNEATVCIVQPARVHLQ
jgi:hypothetical protein